MSIVGMARRAASYSIAYDRAIVVQGPEPERCLPVGSRILVGAGIRKWSTLSAIHRNLYGIFSGCSDIIGYCQFKLNSIHPVMTAGNGFDDSWS